MTPIPSCGAGVGRSWHEELAVLCIPVAWALLPPPSPAVGPPTMPCCARRGTQPIQHPLPRGGSAVLARLLPGLKLNEEGKILKN